VEARNLEEENESIEAGFEHVHGNFVSVSQNIRGKKAHMHFMVKRTGNLYQCEECELLYADIFWAEKCEAWCKKHKSCNLEITEHSVDRLKPKTTKNEPLRGH